MFRSGEFHLGKSRRAIEDRVIAQANALPVHHADGRWVEGEALADYIYAHHALTRYYEQTGDTTLGSGVLDVARAVTLLLNRVVHTREISLNRRERAQSALIELQHQLESMIAQVNENATSRD
jgi:hypothetical protein